MSHRRSAGGAGAPGARSQRAFGWYLGGQACWFFAFGIQGVLYPHLVVNVLHEGPQRIGVAQMAQMAPSLALMMLGGALADAMDLRTLLMRVQLLAVIPPLGLAVALWCAASGSGAEAGPGYGALIVFALAFGSLQAFAAPAREALLSRVAPGELQRAVSTALAVQFLAQVLGFLAASRADRVGAGAVLALQAAAFALAAGAARALAPAAAAPAGRVSPLRRRGFLLALTAGARTALASRDLRPLLMLMAGVGFFFISVFMVVLPVMVRDTYLGGAQELALVNGAFVGGTILSTFGLARGRAVARPGRAMLGAVALCTALTVGFAASPPQGVFYGLIFAFGLASGVLVALGRTLVQSLAPDAERARVLAFYSLCLVGSAPLGAWAVGAAAQAWGIPAAALGSAAGMAVLAGAVASATGLGSLARGGWR